MIIILNCLEKGYNPKRAAVAEAQIPHALWKTGQLLVNQQLTAII